MATNSHHHHDRSCFPPVVRNHVLSVRGAMLLAAMASAPWMAAQTPRTLTGLEYRGTSEASHQEGCEGCGNPGHVEFEAGSRINFTLPGSDMIGSAQYTRKGDTIRIQDSDWTMVLKGDTLFFTAYDYRHVYLRVRE